MMPYNTQWKQGNAGFGIIMQMLRILQLLNQRLNVWVILSSTYFHYENTPIQIYWKFYNQKRENFQIKNSDIFQISAQNIDCGYSLEPPRPF